MKTSLTRGLMVLALLGAAGRMFAADDAAKRWAQYEPSFQAFAELDRAKPPVKGGILFVGSSIFRQWTDVPDMMAPLPVLNRAFGGSRTGDQLARFDQVVRPYAPAFPSAGLRGFRHNHQAGAGAGVARGGGWRQPVARAFPNQSVRTVRPRRRAAVRDWTTGAGLTLHPTKTRIVNAASEGFDFLGWHFRTRLNRMRNS